MKSSVILLITKVVLGIVWGGVILYVLIGSIPESPYPPTQQERLNLLAISPQGWAFFTRDPREKAKHLYVRRKGDWIEKERSNFTLRNWFGIKRIPRIELVELKAMLADVPERQWAACKSDIETCLRNRTVEVVSLANESTTQHLCGEYAIQRREPVPWAWSQDAGDVTIQSEVVRLSISCP